MYRHRHQLLRRPRAQSENLGLFCNYSHRVCMQTRLDGFEYCLKHILEDKTSPYKQCSYTSAKTNRRCTNATLKTERKEGYCFEHSRKACLLRQQASRKRRPKETAESLLAELSQYHEDKPGLSDDGKRRRLTESLASKILDYGSSSDDSDSELPLVEQAWRGDGESDAESIDSEQEDPLKHAGIYTAEEVTLIMRDKLIRLQSLYIEQFKRLQHILKEKRRKYLHATKLDRDSQGLQIAKGDLAAQGKLANLTALKRYHQRHGKEALLQRQSKERRVAVSEGSNYRPPPFPKCSFTSGGSRCNMVAIPLTKFCSKHVVEDRNQVLFAVCGFAQGDCGKPVAAFDPSPLCDLHRPLEDPVMISLNPEEQDTDIMSAETSLEASVQSELSAVDESGLHLLATQSSIMAAVPTASDALSASSDTLSATLDEPYMSSSDVPASGGEVPEASSDIPAAMELGPLSETASEPAQQVECGEQGNVEFDNDPTPTVDLPTVSDPSDFIAEPNLTVAKSPDVSIVLDNGSSQSVANDQTDNL